MNLDPQSGLADEEEDDLEEGGEGRAQAGRGRRQVQRPEQRQPPLLERCHLATAVAIVTTALPIASTSRLNGHPMASYAWRSFKVGPLGPI